MQTALALITPGALTATGSGGWIDASALEGYGMAVLDSAIGTGNADNTANFKLQTSETNDGNGITDLATFGTQVTHTVSGVQQVELNFNDACKYVRLAYTIAGTTPSFVAAALLVGRKKYQP